MNGSYYNAPAVMTISDTLYTNSDDYNRLSGQINVGSVTWTAYDNDSSIATGSLGAGSFSIQWARQTTKGLHEWGVLFTDGITSVWKNGTYQSQGLLIMQLYIGQDNESVFISGQLYSTDLTLSYWVWEDSSAGDVLMGSGSFTLIQTTAWFSITWDKSSENVDTNWTLIVTDGSNNSTAYGWYTELDSAVTNITNNAAHYEDKSTDVESQTIIEGDLYTGPSPEAAMWQTMGYILAVFFTVFAVGVGYYAQKGLSSRRKKHDHLNDLLRTRR